MDVASKQRQLQQDSIHCKFVMWSNKISQPGGQIWNQAMQVTSPDDQMLNNLQTLPEAQRTQGIESLT